MAFGRRRRAAVAGAGAGVMVLGAAALALTLFVLVPSAPIAPPSHRHTAAHVTRTSTPTTVAPNPTASALAGVTVPADTLVAKTDGAIAGYAYPGSPTPDIAVPGTWYGYPSILPVIATQPGWLDVRLAQRPNGSTTWVHESDVTLGNTPYALVLSLATMHLYVFENGDQIFDFPAGIGTPVDPTPVGQYFIPMLYPPPGPGYGPFVLVTSDHSDAIVDWENSGDAIIGIHGPITSYDDSLIGTTGAAISHGCIRLHDADLAQLSVIPPGTPLDVVN